MGRAEKFLQSVLKKLTDQGAAFSHEVHFGHASELLCEIPSNIPGSASVIARTGGNALTNGFLCSLVMTLVQASPVPVTVAP